MLLKKCKLLLAQNIENSLKIWFEYCTLWLKLTCMCIGASLKLSSFLIPYFPLFNFSRKFFEVFKANEISCNSEFNRMSDVSFAMVHICISHDAWNKIFILFIKLFYWQLQRSRQSHPSILIQIFSHQIFISKVSDKSFLFYACLVRDISGIPFHEHFTVECFKRIKHGMSEILLSIEDLVTAIKPSFLIRQLWRFFPLILDFSRMQIRAWNYGHNAVKVKP